MSTLHDRLVELAGDAPGSLPAPGLWERGVGYRRRRRTGTAVVLAVAAVALAVLGSATWLRSPAAVEPLPADSPGGMPDRLYSVSEWLPGTDDDGPLGRVAALFQAVRHTWGGIETGLVGVSASTGEYRFLELPGLANDQFGGNCSLSPDGKYVAYMYRSAGSDAAAERGSEAATGIALYDTRTGEVRRHVLPGERGVLASEWFWTEAGVVVLSYGQVTDNEDGLATRGADSDVVWDVHVQAPHDLVTAFRTFGITSSGPGFVEMLTLDGYVRVDPATGTILRRLDRRTSGVSNQSGSRSADVDRRAVDDGQGDPIVVRTIPSDADDRPTREQVPEVEHAFDVYSWIDDDHLAVLLLEGDPDVSDAVIASVDVHTGETRRLVDNALYSDAQLATDLLAQPTVPGIEPPRPMDPRKVTAGGVLVALGALVALVMWRRRVQP